MGKRKEEMQKRETGDAYYYYRCIIIVIYEVMHGGNDYNEKINKNICLRA